MKARRRGARYWIAMSALAAYTAMGSKTAAIVYAYQSRSPQVAQSQDRPGLLVHRFEIPPGLLAEVLEAFQKATGLRLVAVSDAIRNLSSPGVSGLYTPQQALDLLLGDTGVAATLTAPDTYTLDLRAPSTSITVTESMPTPSSPRYQAPLRDTPQTITIIPKAVIEEQGAMTLRDVLRNVSGLTITAGEGGTPAGDNLTLRGFSARNDLFVDGVRDLGPQSRDSFNVEQVEVVKGPSSAFNGRGSTGGTINMVSKAPGLNPALGGSVALGTDRTRRVTADLNLPLERLGLGPNAAFRLNLLAHSSGVAGRDVVENERWGAAPSLAFGLGTPTRVTASYFKLKQDNISDYGIPWVPATNNVLVAFRDRPAPVPRDTFYGYRSRDIESIGADMATVRFEHDWSDGLSLRSQIRYGRSTRDSIATPPRFASNDSTTINREMRSWITEDEIWDQQTDLSTSFATGPVKHKLVTGALFSREGNIRKTRVAPNSPTTLLNPNPDDIYTGTIVTSPIVGDVTGNTQALYAFDMASLGKHWEVNGGLRWERFDVDGVSTTNTPVVRVDIMNSVRGGIVYKPTIAGSLYASYGTSLNPSLEGLSYSTANTAIEPEKTYTLESGAKWAFAHDRLLLSGAFFRVDKTNARTPGILPDDPPQVLQGTQRVSGIELGATGSITRDWKLFGTYTYLDSTIVESNNPLEVGKVFQNTPRNSYAIWTTYRSPWRLIFGVGPRFVGKRYGNNTNTRWVESYWTIEGMASYAINQRLDLRFNIYNLNNAYYFDRLAGGHLIPGAARSAMFGLNFRF